MLPLSVQPISPDAFASYGRVVALSAVPPTASDDTFAYWSDLASYAIDGDTEIGICTVYRQGEPTISWMERHDKTPEVLIPIDVPFALPVMGDSDKVEIFQVDPGEAVIIDTGVWHSACQPIGASEATYFVVFRRGTPQEDVHKRDLAPLAVSS
ncbi:hypothetical protein BH23BAC4_BH23BAC4_00810 [soil metagenome]